MALYKNKYRIETTRLQTWDYRWNAAYFITICTKHKEHFFGEIVDGNKENEMHYTDSGKFAWNCWAEIPEHFPYITLDAFTVMPNHLHGILILNNPGPVDMPHCNLSDIRNNSDMPYDSEIRTSSTSEYDDDDTQAKLKTKNKTMSVISPKKGSISTILRSYKSAVSKQAHLLNPQFLWQERFYDHIIRNEEEFYKIRNYILTNTQNWKEDMFYN